MAALNRKGCQHAQRPHCLKWDARGELSSVDLVSVLERLRVVDVQAQGLDRCELGCELVRPSHG
ncbi:MAG: hypothetical protein VKK03_01690 [Synechococcus sp.]|nr:hypothetical protein [Synechococcus sp.]